MAIPKPGGPPGTYIMVKTDTSARSRYPSEQLTGRQRAKGTGNGRPCGRPRKQVVVLPLEAPGGEEVLQGHLALRESVTDVEVEANRAPGARNSSRPDSHSPYRASPLISSSNPHPSSQLSQDVSVTWQDDGLDPFDQSPLRYHDEESRNQNGDEAVSAAHNGGPCSRLSDETSGSTILPPHPLSAGESDRNNRLTLALKLAMYDPKWAYNCLGP